MEDCLRSIPRSKVERQVRNQLAIPIDDVADAFSFESHFEQFVWSVASLGKSA